MRCVNKAILLGALGTDPEVRYTPSGVPVVNLSLATNERWKSSDGETQERTEWHRLVLWRQLAEIAGQYLHKGDKVYIEGRIQTRKWADQEGHDHYTTEVVADELVMLSGSRGESEPWNGQATDFPPDDEGEIDVNW